MKIYYITRSYLPMRTGGTLIRKKYVELLKENGFDIEVVTVDYTNHGYHVEYIDGIKVSYFPYKLNLRVGMCFERLGILEDYLDFWATNVLEYLGEFVTPDDVIFCTSGGELASIKVGNVLKQRVGCKFIVNLHDPIDYTVVKGKRIDNKFHVNREEYERRNIENADLIITSSNTMLESLREKYFELDLPLMNGYFGYLDKYKGKLKRVGKEKLQIVYGGNFGELQKPELFARAVTLLEGVEVYFVGDSTHYKPIDKYRDSANVYFVESMPYDEYCDFVKNKMDCGCVSLTSDYLGACVPSKIYEFINLGIPMIACLPEGDAKSLIERNGYGIVCDYSSIEDLCKTIEKYKDNMILEQHRYNIEKDRDNWSMEELIKPVVDKLKCFALR